MDAEGLPPEFVDLVRRERTRVLPCVGAGLSIPAGIRDLASDVAHIASERGVEIAGDDLASVVQALELQRGVEETQAIVAEAIISTPVQPTRTQKALALCPLGIVATFNYDDCLERAAGEMGRTPLPLLPNTARAFRRPGPGELVVLHLHGSAADPSSIVLPGRTTEQLASNDAFMRLLTSLWTQYVVVYFGFSFAPSEVHLLGALEWLARELPDADKQRLLLRELEAQQRAEDLAPLVSIPLLEVVPYPDTPDHRAVHQAALLLGPTNEPAPDNLSTVAPAPVAHYEPAALLEVEPGAEPSVIQADALRAEWGMGGEWVSVDQLLDAGRTLVTAAPGMGKTQLVRIAGREPGRAQKPVLCQLKELPGLLDGTEDPWHAFARMAAGAQAFDDQTPVPSRERLEDGSYMFLLDALDEVPPRRRPEVADAVVAAVERWPQHGYLVTTRPTVDAARLVGAGFRSFRIVPSEGWGGRYFQRRGVPDRRVVELREKSPAASNLLSIPTYAAAIGERLADGDELSDRPIDLLLDPVRTLASEEALKQGRPQAAYLAWLQRLAVGLELRGRNEASTAELAALPGPEAEDAATTRERLVEAALLSDIPDRAEFPRRTVQEALCADALLRCADVVAAVRTVAAADLDGEEVFRGDIEHCLDQVWTNADAGQRAALRDLDPLRWARTITVGCTAADAEQALDIIWSWHYQHRLWMNWGTRGQLRGASESISLLTDHYPEVIRSRREEFIGATQSQEPTARGNAVDILSGLGSDEDAAGWLVPRLGDDNEVVRGLAASAARRLNVREALPVLREMFPGRQNESEAEAVARAVIALTPDAELGEVAQLLRQNGRVWGSVKNELIRRLTLDDTLAVLDAGVANAEEQVALLGLILQRDPPQSWQAAQVQRLSAILARDDVQLFEVPNVAHLREVLAGDQEAALRGIRDAAADGELHWSTLWFVESFQDELLRAELDGPAADAYAVLLEHKAAMAEAAEAAEAVPDASALAPRAGGQRAAADAASSLGRDLDERRVREDRVPDNPRVWPVENLTDGQRERLAELVQSWWPAQPLAEVVRHTGRSVEGNNGAVAAVCAAAALDLAVTDARWLDVFAAPGVMVLQPDTVGWLHRQYRPGVEEGAAAIIRAAHDEWHVYYAIGAFPVLQDAVARAFAERLHLVRDPLRFAHLLQTLVSAGHRELLGQFDESALDAAQRHALLEAKASAGDADAQLALVDEALAHVRDGVRGPPLRFSHAVTDERLIAPLAELLDLLGQSARVYDDLQRSAIQAMAASRSVTALRAYDRLMEADSPAAAFFWYPRAELAQTMATEAVLARLPEAVADVPAVVEGQGWHPGPE
jgi:hypothetical protein